jgi:hypothetical protein
MMFCGLGVEMLAYTLGAYLSARRGTVLAGGQA